MQPSRAGFSIIEVMVAMGILAVAILATLAALSQSAQLRQASSENEAASQALQAAMGQVRSAPTTNDVVAFDGFAFPVNDPNLNINNPTTPTTLTCEILNEAECSDLFRYDIDDSGTQTVPPTPPEAGDLYDLDGDANPGETDVTTPGDTTTGSNFPDYETRIPVRLTITWESHTGGVQTMTMMSMVYPSDTN